MTSKAVHPARATATISIGFAPVPPAASSRIRLWPLPVRATNWRCCLSACVRSTCAAIMNASCKPHRQRTRINAESWNLLQEIFRGGWKVLGIGPEYRGNTLIFLYQLLAHSRSFGWRAVSGRVPTLLDRRFQSGDKRLTRAASIHVSLQLLTK